MSLGEYDGGVEIDTSRTKMRLEDSVVSLRAVARVIALAMDSAPSEWGFLVAAEVQEGVIRWPLSAKRSLGYCQLGEEIAELLPDRQRLRSTRIGDGIPFFTTVPYQINFRFLISASTREFLNAVWRRNTGDGGRSAGGEGPTRKSAAEVAAAGRVRSDVGLRGGTDDQ